MTPPCGRERPGTGAAPSRGFGRQEDRRCGAWPVGQRDGEPLRTDVNRRGGIAMRLVVPLMLFTVAAPLAAQDSAFRALQDRGKTAMGVDQYTSLHRFDPLPDGGRIVLVRDSTDAAGIA